MSVINTNVSALYAQDAIKTNSRLMRTTMEQLSTGTRINSASDDAAGLAIGQNMTSQVRGLNQAVRNLNDGITMMQTAEGSLVETSNMLQRMRELAVQSSNGTYSDTQRGFLNTEFVALKTQIGRIASETKWNEQALLTTATFTMQAGAAATQTIAVTMQPMTLTGLVITTTDTVSTVTLAIATIAVVDAAIGLVNSQRATLGAGINQMTYGADNLTSISSNLVASRSNIMDTDYAVASTQLAKTQIIQQAATAMLAQANQQPQSVLALLK